ncbi:ATP-binding protein [Telmatospirillum sp. J64-1]|uniref:ATP-binding protein n=1 Tax=Telmatospirillum sp. J64-1 TaxID=2502183 RepID=UPI00115EFBB5|nr:ATP-binding protein [Telmatospirillum sp. J64-1]
MELLTTTIRNEADVVTVRQRARQLAAMLGFDTQDQTRISTAVSEVARNAQAYAGGGKARFGLNLDGEHPLFSVEISDQGPGIPNLQSILDGQYVSSTGMGIGLMGVRRLMDDFAIDTGPKGTKLRLVKHLPRHVRPPSPREIGALVGRLAQESGPRIEDELYQQNQEILRNLEELRRRQEDLRSLNAELEETNRGVVALYAELEDKAEQLRRAHELKTRFMSHIGHEFRTPVNAILALARMLLDRMDGPLTEEQERQVGFIQKAAGDLGGLVDDLLDLARVEAGKTPLEIAPVAIEELFGTLRGIIKPLLRGDAVALHVDPAPPGLEMTTDESKLSQILRNFLSNAVKFTEKGEIRLSLSLDGGQVIFTVRDSGIGIPEENLETVFEEFSQVRNPLQRQAKGTGLGLSLSRKLAALLGGEVWAESRLGEGSAFHLRLPLHHPSIPPVQAEEEEETHPAVPAPALDEAPILIVDDDPAARYVLRQILLAENRVVAEAGSADEAREWLDQRPPCLIFLDLVMGTGIDGFQFLAELKRNAATAAIPVIVCTSQSLDDSDLQRLTAATAILPKKDVRRDTVAGLLQTIFPKGAAS